MVRRLRAANACTGALAGRVWERLTSWVTRTGQRDLAKTASVVDVHLTRRTDQQDIDVGGLGRSDDLGRRHSWPEDDFGVAPGLPSGAIAANSWLQMSVDDGLGSVITRTHVTCPCVSLRERSYDNPGV
jgi:hypothetical protein